MVSHPVVLECAAVESPDPDRGVVVKAFVVLRDKVIESLEYWIPLLEAGYRVVRSQESGRFEVTALTGRGTATRSVEASGPDDPRIRAAVEELRKFQ